MKTRSKLVNQFIEKIQNEAERHGVKVTLTKCKNVYNKDGGPPRVCHGIFIPPTRPNVSGGIIRVAAGDQPLAEVLLSLAHEFIHMRQYFNREKIYYTPSYYKLEKNTERRAISFMKKNGLPKYLVEEAERLSKDYLKLLAIDEKIKVY
jgi:hypothetical protein